MELIKNFGLDPVLLLAQIVNFLIILYILRRFLYRPILSILEKRKTLIKEGLEKTEEARIRLEKVMEEEKNILKNAQTQAKKLIDDAKKESLELMQKTELHSKVYADRLIVEARQQIALQTKDAEKRITIHVSKLAIGILEKSLSQLFSKDDQEALMKNILRRFQQKLN